MGVLADRALTLALLACFISIGVLAKGKSERYRPEIAEYQFKFPYLASIAMYLNEKIDAKYFPFRRLHIKGKLADLFGQGRAGAFLVVHQAQKTALSLGILFLIGIIFTLGGADSASWFFCLFLVVLFFFWPDYAVVRRLEVRKRNLLLDLPVFLNALVLLMNAGLPFAAAMERVVGENMGNRPLFIELRKVLTDMETGKPVSQAFEDLAFRCRVPEITRMVNAVLQNIHRGGSTMIYVLLDLSQTAWEKRRDLARKQGEEASTKLILPMVMVFLAVAIIVLAPAVTAMSR